MVKLNRWVVIALGIGLTALAVPCQAARNSTEKTLVKILPEALLMQSEYTERDDVAVTLVGSYMDTCYTEGPATAQVEENQDTILISNQAFFSPNQLCLYVLKPYSKVVDIGRLKPGAYRVLAEIEKGPPQELGVLVVSK